MNQTQITTLGGHFNLGKFPTGEPLWSAKFPDNIQDMNEMILIHQCYDWNDVLTVIAIDQFLKRKNINVEFYIPYLPSGRNDRPTLTHGSDAHFIVDLIKMYNVNVITADPHSYVTAEIRHIPQSLIVDYYRTNNAWRDRENYFLIPDQGAYTKAKTWLRAEDRYFVAGKTRDPNTGKLTRFDVDLPDDFDIKSHRLVIVDDIWDGGGTFVGLSQEIQRQSNLGPQDVNVFITHGLFNKGFDASVENFGDIGCFNYQPPARFATEVRPKTFRTMAHYELYRFIAGNYHKII